MPSISPSRSMTSQLISAGGTGLPSLIRGSVSTTGNALAPPGPMLTARAVSVTLD